MSAQGRGAAGASPGAVAMAAQAAARVASSGHAARDEEDDEEEAVGGIGSARCSSAGNPPHRISNSSTPRENQSTDRE